MSTRSFYVRDSVDVIADRARAAALELLGSAASPWGKRELAKWLAGPYRRAVSESLRPCPPKPSTEDGPSLTNECVAKLVASARRQAVDTIDARACSSLAELELDALAHGLVVRIHDAKGL